MIISATSYFSILIEVLNLYAVLGASTIVVYRGCSEGFDIMVVIVDFCQIYGKLVGKVVSIVENLYEL